MAPFGLYIPGSNPQNIMIPAIHYMIITQKTRRNNGDIDVSIALSTVQEERPAARVALAVVMLLSCCCHAVMLVSCCSGVAVVVPSCCCDDAVILLLKRVSQLRAL